MADLQHLGLTKATLTDRGLQLSRPVAAPSVMIIGCTDNTAAPLEDPYRLERGSSISDFDLAAGTPSEITKAVQECQAGGAENIEIFVLSDGSGTRFNSLTNVNRYNLLARAYGLLKNHDTDIVVPVGALVDAASLVAGTSMAYQLANHCFRATREFTSRMGVIGASAPASAVATTGRATLAEMAAWATALAAFDTSGLLGVAFPEYDGVTDAGADGVPDNYALWATTDEVMPSGAPPASDGQVMKDINNNPIDIGAYIMCYAGWERFRNQTAKRLYPTLGYYNNNGAAAFAGLLAATPANEAPRNVPLPGAEAIRYLSPAQADSLATSRFIVSARKLGQYQIYDAMTAAYNISTYYRSDYIRVTTVRVTFDAIDQVRAAANPFIRKDLSQPNIEALEQAIDEGLGKLKNHGLERWDWDLIMTTAMRILGQIEIDLKLWISPELQSVTVRIGLQQ